MASKSKWFRVAVEGATTDGREITRQQILEMADTFEPATYGARVNLEHYRGIVPDGPFDILGDVTGLKSQEDDIKIGGKTEKRLGLYAQIEPLPRLVEYNKARQKIYTSIEFYPDFSNTGKAGFAGLAVTDSPASLGTEVLTFAAKNPAASPFVTRKQAEGNLFTAALETEIVFEDEPASADQASAFAAITAFFTKLTGAAPAAAASATTPAANVNPPASSEPAGGKTLDVAGMAAFAEGMAKLSAAIDKSVADLAAATGKNTADLAALAKQLEDAPAGNRFTQRPAASGGDQRARAPY